jgi:enamine deaminase RidA (YjgF/YER057c/UK114 family)
MPRLPSVLIATLLLSACAIAPTAAHKTIIVPAGRDILYDNYHFAPVMRVGDTVIVSGLPAAKGATYEDKVRNMFEALKRTLAAAGADLADVVEINTFHAQAKDTATFNDEFSRFVKIHAEYFPDHYPAWTAVGTTALLAEGAVVEMRVLAVVGSGRQAEIQRAKPTKP